VRIVEDKLDRKPKGFGYVEYASLDGLKKALELNGSQFQGRNIRISIAEPRTSQVASLPSSYPNITDGPLQQKTARKPAT